MSKPITEVIAEVRNALGESLSPGIEVWAGPDAPLQGDYLLVGNDILAFAITREEVLDNLAVPRAVMGIAALRIALSQHYALLAAQYSRSTLLSVANVLSGQYETLSISEIGNAGHVLN